MQLLRSEEHLERYRAERELPAGQTMTLTQQWQLASAWYGRRLEPDWRRYTLEEAREVLAACGLTGEFWALG